MTEVNGLAVGAPAPQFTATRDGGGIVALKDFKGKSVVLYFYPKDDTPGCTVEAVEFTGLLKEFEAAGAVIIGVSRDPVSKHEKFRDKHDLKVTLITDEDGSITENYGVWVEKMNFGKKYMGIERATYLIDAEGKIAHVWRKVKAQGHAAEVLRALKDG